MADGFDRIEPGTRAKWSGQYSAHADDGTPLGYEATVTRGEPLPPTQVPGFWLLVDPTQRKEGTENAQNNY